MARSGLFTHYKYTIYVYILGSGSLVNETGIGHGQTHAE